MLKACLRHDGEGRPLAPVLLPPHTPAHTPLIVVTGRGRRAIRQEYQLSQHTLTLCPGIVFPVIHSPNQEPWNEFHMSALFYHKRRTHWLVSRHKVGIAAQRLGSCCVSELRRQWSVRPDPASGLTLYFFCVAAGIS